MIALQTSVELSRRLVAAPRLKKPPHRFVVPASGAVNLGDWECGKFALLIADDLYRRYARKLLLSRLHHGLSGLVRETTVVAQVGDRDPPLPLDLLEFESGAALWTELQSDSPPRALVMLFRSS